jgi:hypothetical protein
LNVVNPGSLLVAETSVNRAGPESASDTFTGTETGISLPFGGHRLIGVAEQVTTGAMVSTIQVKDAGVGSAVPERSTARTRNVWLSFAKPA